MELTLEQIANAKPVLERLLGEPMDTVQAYRLQKNISALNLELNGIESFSKEVMEKCGGEVDTEGIIHIDPKGKDKYNEEISKVLKEKVEVNIMPIDIFKIISKITPLELMAIDWMIDSTSI
jgi:hypothetical protein